MAESARVQPSLVGILLLASASLTWFLATLGHVQVVQQLCLLLVIAFLCWGTLGYQVTRMLSFPMLLMLFAIPLWDVVRTYFQHFTANIVVALLNGTGVPAVLEGLFILVPAGTFEVSDGCGGLSQFLVASVLALMYAHVNGLGPKSGLKVIIAAGFVGMLMNTLRIYVVVVAGQLTAMQHSFVTNHWNLGWALFGIGMFVFLLWANRYVAPETKAVSKRKQCSLSGGRVPNSLRMPSALTRLRTAVLVLVALAVGPVLAHIYAGQSAPGSAPGLAIPKQIGVWRATGTGGDPYRPRFHGADLEYDTLYRAADGVPIYLYVAYYGRQEQGKEAVYYSNKVYDDRRWKSIGAGTRDLPTTAPSGRLRVRETQVQSNDGRKRIIWQWYYVNGSRTSNDYLAKILNVLGMLQRDSSIAVVVIASDVNGDDEKARLRLARFVTEAMEKLERGIDATRSM